MGEYLGIETGLAYSNLRANGQGLHYLGIPVKMNVYLADLKKFDLYASIGAVADKCIAGAPSNNFKNEPVQLAVTAGVGVSYKVNDRIALLQSREYHIILIRIRELKRYVPNAPLILTFYADFA